MDLDQIKLIKLIFYFINELKIDIHSKFSTKFIDPFKLNLTPYLIHITRLQNVNPNAWLVGFMIT